jgi:hypothetical protein
VLDGVPESKPIPSGTIRLEKTPSETNLKAREQGEDMHLVIRKITLDPSYPISETAERLYDQFLPVVSAAPGFVGWFALVADDEHGYTVSIFENAENAQESTSLAREWTQDNYAALMSAPIKVVAEGEVIAYKIIGSSDNVLMMSD